MSSYIDDMKKAVSAVESVTDESLKSIGWDEIPLVLRPTPGERIFIRKGNPMSFSRDEDSFILQLCFSHNDERSRLDGIFFDKNLKCGECDSMRQWVVEILTRLIEESQSLLDLGYEQTQWTEFKRKYDESRQILVSLYLSDSGFHHRLSSYPVRIGYRVVMEKKNEWDPARDYGEFDFRFRLSERVVRYEKERMSLESISTMNKRLLEEMMKTPSEETSMV